MRRQSMNADTLRKNISQFAPWLVILLCLAPEWFAFLKSNVFVFVNGWDEESYLSWQGVLGAKDLPGYYVSYLNLVLHNIGISGAIQNLIFDSLFFPITVCLIHASFKSVGFGGDRKFLYALILSLSSVLFNYANPVVPFVLGPYDGKAILMAGHEYYPTILRTPNPQISYFFVALATYLFLRFKRFWILWVPLPLLYYYVAVPYVFFIGMYFTWRFFSLKRQLSSYQNYLISFLLWFVCVAVGLSILFYLSGLYKSDNYIRQSEFVFFATRFPQFPLFVLILGGVGYLMSKLGWMHTERHLITFLVWLGLAAFASVNIHLVSGFMLSQKNYYDYGLSVLLGLGLVVMIELLKNERVKKTVLLTCLALTSYFALQSQISYARYAIYMSPKVAAVLERSGQDSLHAVIPDLAVSSSVAYSMPKLLAPPFSYLYYFKFIAKQCDHYETLLDNAFYYSEVNLIEKPEQLKLLADTMAIIKKNRQEQISVPYKNRGYCDPEIYNDKSFKLIL